MVATRMYNTPNGPHPINTGVLLVWNMYIHIRAKVHLPPCISIREKKWSSIYCFCCWLVYHCFWKQVQWVTSAHTSSIHPFKKCIAVKKPIAIKKMYCSQLLPLQQKKANCSKESLKGLVQSKTLIAVKNLYIAVQKHYCSKKAHCSQKAYFSKKNSAVKNA